MHLINDSASLAHHCHLLARHGQGFLYIDTEFMRRSTYFPKVCLIQCAAGEGESRTVMIDALSPNLNLDPLKALLLDSEITKVFHDCSQDLEALNHRLGECLPYPLYDTQMAGVLCGLGSLSFKDLVLKLLGVSLDKEAQCSLWHQRPLTAQQLRYASDEVRYLRLLHGVVQQHLDHLDRSFWMNEEMEILAQRSSKKSSLRLASAYSIHSVVYQRIAALEMWRELQAQRCDKPRQWILTDAQLLQTALTSNRASCIPPAIYKTLKPLEPGVSYRRLYPRSYARHPLKERLDSLCRQQGFPVSLLLQGRLLDDLIQDDTQLTGWRKIVWQKHIKPKIHLSHHEAS